MTTTTYKQDYLGCRLSNATPGTSAATDRLGRSVGASNTDWLGRKLVEGPWVLTTAYAVGAQVYLAGGAELICTVAGTSAGTPPTAPSVGATVVDGTVTWKRTA